MSAPAGGAGAGGRPFEIEIHIGEEIKYADVNPSTIQSAQHLMNQVKAWIEANPDNAGLINVMMKGTSLDDDRIESIPKPMKPNDLIPSLARVFVQITPRS